LRAEIDKLHMIIKAFQRHRYGQRAEQLNADERQLVIEDLEQTMGEGAAAIDGLGGSTPSSPTAESAVPCRASSRRASWLTVEPGPSRTMEID
jgi:hypothetical protein